MENCDRAERGQVAVSAFVATETDSYRLEKDEVHLQDLLIDLRHWAAQRDLDFDFIDRNSEFQFGAEVDEDIASAKAEIRSDRDVVRMSTERVMGCAN
jgi:hypothetical protein